MSILPTGNVGNQPGYFGPNYDFAAAVPLPGQIGVRRGDSLGSVIDAVRGAAYYVDVIGFGERSSELTANRPIAPLGVNYFLRTGLQCSNGADMWYYVNGIPDGTALGKRVRDALASSRLPALRGLAPGILEDAKDALNPKPVLNALLGSGYPKCKKVTLPVGDSFKQIRSGEDQWIFGPVQYDRAGWPTQTYWIQDVDRKGNPVFLTQDEWNKEPKEFCGDGSAKKDHPDEDCSIPIGGAKKEGFSTDKISPSKEQLVVTAGLAVASAIAIAVVLMKKH
jgi:hypothetical protein